MTANIRDAMAGLAPRDDDDDDYAPRPEANPRRLDPGNMEEGSRGSATQQGQQDYARGLSKQQNPYYKSQKGTTPPEAYDWEAGWEYARDAGKEPGVSETVTNVRAGMAEIYHRLAPKIERYKDSFLAGQLYDELENYAELHGAEAEFKRMMATARNSAHMEYDTNPGGFHNWFWFLPFENVAEVKADSVGSWVVYNGSKVKRFKTHSGAKAYAEKAGGKVASSEFYADKVQKTESTAKLRASGLATKRDRFKSLRKESVQESYWTRLQNERSTKLNTLINELKESVNK
jgi:hypothetical protein